MLHYPYYPQIACYSIIQVWVLKFTASQIYYNSVITIIISFLACTYEYIFFQRTLTLHALIYTFILYKRLWNWFKFLLLCFLRSLDPQGNDSKLDITSSIPFPTLTAQYWLQWWFSIIPRCISSFGNYPLDTSASHQYPPLWLRRHFHIPYCFHHEIK